jgi:pSer/pThr/pTyr-binding forkhead associated (FHA) protein
LLGKPIEPIFQNPVVKILGEAPMAEIQLVVTTPPGQVRVYSVNKDQLTIGRALTSDIVLYDPGVSRQHARLHRVADGFEIEDLGSTNGTGLQGHSIERAPLAIGQTVRLANSTLRLQQAPTTVPDETNPQDVNELTTFLSSAAMEMELPDLSLPRLVVHTRWRTWEITLTDEVTTIGRQSNCQVFLQDSSVSRQHARIVRERDAFVLIDLDSHNGTWVNDQRIERYTLRPGDSFKVGGATFVFNAPLADTDLTVQFNQTFALTRGARRPVVFIPGFMGSELWIGNERIWPNVKAMFTQPELYQFPSQAPVEARQLVSQIVVIPRLIKVERYSALGDFLCEELGYERDKNLLEFAWDWRQDLYVAAQRLGEHIERWRDQSEDARAPLTLIAHSIGCLIARYYVEKLGGQSIVSRMILIGGTHRGMPKALQVFSAFGKQSPLYGIAEPFQRALATAPSVYMLLPTYPAVFNSDGQPLDLFRDESWCPEQYRLYLRNALAFHQELSPRPKTSTICIFGYGMPTITSATLENPSPDGFWERIQFKVTEQGDDTVPEVSARLPQTEIHPIHQHHASLYADNDVKVRLKLELLR